MKSRTEHFAAFWGKPGEHMKNFTPATALCPGAAKHRYGFYGTILCFTV